MSIIQQILLGMNSGFVVPAYFNPADAHGNIVLTSSNSVAASNHPGGTTWVSVRGVTPRGAAGGKWYFEVEDTVDGTNGHLCGVMTAAANLATYLGAGAGGWGVQPNAPGHFYVYTAGSYTDFPSSTLKITAGGRCKFAYEPATGKLWMGTSGGGGGWHGGGDPAAGTSPTWTLTAGTVLYPAASLNLTVQRVTLKNQVGENSMAIPSGFSMWA